MNGRSGRRLADLEARALWSLLGIGFAGAIAWATWATKALMALRVAVAVIASKLGVEVK